LDLIGPNSKLCNLTSAWVKEMSVDVQSGAVVGYRVNLLVTFVLE
jgi:flavin-binding protein dodecin